MEFMNSNLAYNLELFEPIEEKKRIEQKKQLKNKVRKKQQPLFWVLTKFAVVAMTIMGLTVSYLFLCSYTATERCMQQELAKELKVMESETVRLNYEINKRHNPNDVITYVTEVCGFVKADASQICYINTNPDTDQIVICDGKEVKQ
jgi:hypothetical protein